jgi:hypothetical protein
MCAYVATATTSSIVFALVKPDNIRTKPALAVMITTSLAVKLSTKLQIMTGVKSKTMMNGVISIRAASVIDEEGNMCTFRSPEMSS